MLFSSLTQPVTLYDSAGTEVHAPPTGSYFAPVNIRQTGTTAAATTVWYLNAAGSLSLYIRRIVLGVHFDGTAAAALQRYDVMRYGTAVCSAGTAITVVLKSSGGAATTATAGFADTGVTTTNVAFETALTTMGVPISVTGKSAIYKYDFTTPGQKYGELVIANGKGLAIQLSTVAAVVGQSVTGYVEWDEK